jgi:hypothetical protein
MPCLSGWQRRRRSWTARSESEDRGWLHFWLHKPRPGRIARTGAQCLRGGDEGTRTLNPRRARAVLYQLSYVPIGPTRSPAGRWPGRCLWPPATVPGRHVPPGAVARGRPRPRPAPPAVPASSSMTPSCGPCCRRAAVGLGGLEPPASSLSGMRSNRLSYRPVAQRVRVPVRSALSQPGSERKRPRRARRARTATPARTVSARYHRRGPRTGCTRRIRSWRAR